MWCSKSRAVCKVRELNVELSIIFNVLFQPWHHLMRRFKQSLACRMPQLLKCRGFDLPYALSCDSKLLANLFKRLAPMFIQAVTALEDLHFPFIQCMEHYSQAVE